MESTIMTVVNENKQEKEVFLSSPLFAVIYDKTRLKMAELEDKNAKLTAKNEKAQAKIDKAKNLVELFEQIKDPNISKAIPTPVFKFIEKVAEIEQERMVSLKNKIEKRNNKIANNNNKVEKHTQRLETCKKIDTFLQKLKSPTEKKEVFIEGLQEFNNIALNKATNKLADVEDKIVKAATAYEKTHSASDRLKLKKKIRKLTEQKEALESKLTDLGGITDRITAIQNASRDKADEVISKSYDGIVNAVTENPDEFSKNQAETVVEVCSEIIDEELLQSKEQEKEIVLPQPTSTEYRDNVSEAEIKKLKEANIKFDFVKDSKSTNCYIIKYDKANSDNVKQILNMTLENQMKR